MGEGLNFENSRSWKEKNGKIPGGGKNFDGILGVAGSKNIGKFQELEGKKEENSRRCKNFDGILGEERKETMTNFRGW